MNAQPEAPKGDVYLLAPLDDAGAIAHSYLLLVESETDTRQLLTELLGAECRSVEVEGEDDALLFLKSGVVPRLLLVDLLISPGDARVLADVFREYRSFGVTSVRELPGEGTGGRLSCLETLSELLDLCAAAAKSTCN
jgi:hypothetical protein